MPGYKTHSLPGWFSYWEAHDFYDGELFMTKLVMSGGKSQDDSSSLEELLKPLEADGLTDKEQLRKLKMTVGTWSLCPTLITGASWWRNELCPGCA